MNGFCCGVPIKGLVSVAFCHYALFGLFAVVFVFTNECYPPLYHVDYLFGISGATLTVVSIVGTFVANMKKLQSMRIIVALILAFNVLLLVTSCFYYTVARWDDVMVTSLTSIFRKSLSIDFPDYLWFFLVVFACVNGPVLIFYMIYILSFMCKPWKSYLFTQPYQNYVGITSFSPSLSMPIVPPQLPKTNK